MAPLTLNDLAAEIRNDIYYLVLCNDGKTFSVNRDFVNYREALKSERSTCKTAILATNRKINSEATPILYGNKIVVTATNEPDFIKQIGGSVVHLRHLQIGVHGSDLNLKRATKALSSATKMDILRVGIYDLGRSRNPWYMAMALKPWVKGKLAQKDDEEEEKDVCDIIDKVSFSPRASYEVGGWVLPKIPSGYALEVKANLASLMG